MSEVIRLSLGDWQYNAGIIGFYRILKSARKDILAFSNDYKDKNHIKSNCHELFVPVEYLENFTENYYSYLIDEYENQISYGKIVNFNVKKYLTMDLNEINDDDIDEVNKYIKNILKYYIKSSSYKAGLELIEGSSDVVDKILNINSVNTSKKYSDTDKKNDLISVCKEISEIIEVLKREQYKKYLGAKNVIYTIINRNWNDVSILNSQVKEKDIYKEFDNYFVKTALDYLVVDKEKYKYECHCCGSKIKNLDNNIKFINNMGFDVARKTSHVWDFNNDIAICDICKLIYTCMPAGFIYGYDKGIFVNSNANIGSLIEINEKVKSNMKNSIKNSESSQTYKSIVNAITERINESSEYELLDIQVVFNENDRYKFNILHKNILKLIYNSTKELKNIQSGNFRENKKNVYLYETTIRHILDNRNMFLWIDKLIRYYITKKSECYYNLIHVENILKINFEYLKEVGFMKNQDKDVLTKMRIYGYYLKEDYKSKKSEKKLIGLTHKLLNFLRTSNVDGFIDLIVRAYSYSGKGIPKDFMDCLRSEEGLKTNGYAFILGLNGAEKDGQ